EGVGPARVSRAFARRRIGAHRGACRGGLPVGRAGGSRSASQEASGAGISVYHARFGRISIRELEFSGIVGGQEAVLISSQLEKAPMNPLPANKALDNFFFEARSKLLDLAAFLDRINRGKDASALSNEDRKS